MHPSRMAFVAIGTTVAFLAALVWTGAYFASAGPSDAELPHALIDLPLVAPVQSFTDLGTGADPRPYLALSPIDASTAPTATATTTTLPIVAQTNTATTGRPRTASKTSPPKTASTIPTTASPTTLTAARAILPPTARTTGTSTATTRTTVLVSSNTTLPYFETTLPLGKETSTEREVVHHKLREDSD